MALLAVVLALLVVACGSRREFQGSGERIYFTGLNDDGQRIAYRSGPAPGVMMRSSMTCASCHGIDARGGTRRIHMSVMTAPDIRWSVLAAGEDAEDSGHGDGHETYTVETFRRAVIDGRHPDGALLDADMPRWSLSDRDLADVATFLEDAASRLRLRTIERGKRGGWDDGQATGVSLRTS